MYRLLQVETQIEGIDIQVANIGVRRNITLLRVQGYVDTTTSPQLHKVMSKMISEGSYQIIVDLGAVNYISSAGWGVFVGEIRGIRENGGDLKIIQMTPDVYEVFEMLEFNRILTAYDSLEEAMDDFDLCMGQDLTRSFEQVEEITRSKNNGFSSDAPNEESQDTFKSSMKSGYPAKDIPSQSDIAVNEPTYQEVSRHRTITPRTGSVMEDANLPLTEKIKKLVIENPISGIWAIKRTLYSPRFGYTKISYLKLRSIMKRLNLDTRTKRYRYFRSR